MALRACSRALIYFLASAVLRLKRIDSLPVSTMWQWWVRRSSSAAVIFASPNTLDHSAKSRFNAAKIVMQTPLPESLTLALFRATLAPHKRR